MIKNKLKVILAERDLSINKLSEMTNIRYATLHSFVKQRVVGINSDVLNKVCKTLELTPGEILVYEPDKE